MVATPAHIQEILDEMRDVLLRWEQENILGEVVCVRGKYQYEVEERLRRRQAVVKRDQQGGKPIVKVGQ